MFSNRSTDPTDCVIPPYVCVTRVHVWGGTGGSVGSVDRLVGWWFAVTPPERFARSLPKGGAFGHAQMGAVTRDAVRLGLVKREKVSVGRYRFIPAMECDA